MEAPDKKITMRADADRAEVAAIGREDAVNFAPLGDRRYGAIDKAEIEIRKSGVELQGPNQVAGKRQFVLVSSRRIEHLRD